MPGNAAAVVIGLVFQQGNIAVISCPRRLVNVIGEAVSSMYERKGKGARSFSLANQFIAGTFSLSLSCTGGASAVCRC